MGENTASLGGEIPVLVTKETCQGSTCSDMSKAEKGKDSHSSQTFPQNTPFLR